MASAFAGYYLALFLILWCLILRGIALEVGGHINDHLWQGFWDFVFVVSSFLLAILFGAAAGNLARGVPLDAHGNFSMAFFTDFQGSRQRGPARLVHGIHRDLRGRHACRPWRDIPHAQDGRSRARPQRILCKMALDGHRSALGHRLGGDVVHSLRPDQTRN